MKKTIKPMEGVVLLDSISLEDVKIFKYTEDNEDSYIDRSEIVQSVLDINEDFSGRFKIEVSYLNNEKKFIRKSIEIDMILKSKYVLDYESSPYNQLIEYLEEISEDIESSIFLRLYDFKNID